MIFYVTGRTLPFLDPAPSNTGILDVQTIPTSATILLDGKEVGTSPATIRFIKQGWHEVSVNQEGYYPWVKQLFIQAGQVTYAGTIQDAIQLLPNKPVSTIAEQVTTVASNDNRVLYAKGNELTYYDLGSQKIIHSGTVNSTITHLEPTSQAKFWLADLDNQTKALFNTERWELIVLPKSITTNSHLEFLNEDTVIALQANTLRTWTIGSSQTTDLLAEVTAFTFKDNLFYLMTTSKTGSELATYSQVNNTLKKDLVLLNQGLPTGNIQLYLTDQKELFLLANDSFYRVNQELELLKTSVLHVLLSNSPQRLTFFTPTEVYFYNFYSGRAELLARSTETLTAADVIPELGYGFIASQNGSEAIEIDTRGNQNRYHLFKDNAVTEMLISQNENELVILANQTLYSLKIK